MQSIAKEDVQNWMKQTRQGQCTILGNVLPSEISIKQNAYLSQIIVSLSEDLNMDTAVPNKKQKPTTSDKDPLKTQKSQLDFAPGTNFHDVSDPSLLVSAIRPKSKQEPSKLLWWRPRGMAMKNPIRKAAVRKMACKYSNMICPGYHMSKLLHVFH